VTLILGLTGSIGMGKSAVAALFAKAGVPVFDADAMVHHLQGPDGALLDAIEAAFPGTTGPAGVDRPALAARVFHNRTALARLEAIVYPALGHAQRAFIRRQHAKPLLVLDIPLLFEKRRMHHIDRVAVVSATAWQQRRRVLARPQMSWAKLRAIRALQLADPQKRRRADFIIPTGGTIYTTKAVVRRIIACTKAKTGR
jgi:dephospho-CoA kinase